MENKSKVAVISGPLIGFHSLTSEHLGSSSQERNERRSVAKPSTSSREEEAIPIPASNAFIGAITELTAESISPPIFPSNDPTKFSTAHIGVLINLSII